MSPIDQAKGAVETVQGLSDASKNASEMADQLGQMKDSVDRKLQVFGEAGNVLGEIVGNQEMSKAEKAKKWKELAVLTAIGLFFTDEDVDHFEEGIEEIDPNETIENTPHEVERVMEVKRIRKKSASGVTLSDSEKNELTLNEGMDEKATRRQVAVNLFAIRYFDKNGKPRDRESITSGMAKYLVQEDCYPSKFLIEKKQLFENGLGTFEQFKQTISDKLVDETVTDPKERLRQAVVILSCSAGGCFGIIPKFVLEKDGLKTTGEEGAKNLYQFFGSVETQISFYKDILATNWKKYDGNPGAVGVAYYSGSADNYIQDPRNPRWMKPQYGVSKENIDLADYTPDKPPRGSIRSYALKAERLFNEFKQKMPGLNDIDYMAMAIEKIESGGSVIHNRIKDRGKPGSGSVT